MADQMTFPGTVDEFMEQYKIVDDEKVYTNGADLVPIFRMMQWFEHEGQKVRCDWEQEYKLQCIENEGLREQCNRLRADCEKLKQEKTRAEDIIGDCKARIRYFEEEKRRLEGYVAGLRFAVRCFGISGPEVER